MHSHICMWCKGEWEHTIKPCGYDTRTICEMCSKAQLDKAKGVK